MSRRPEVQGLGPPRRHPFGRSADGANTGRLHACSAHPTRSAENADAWIVWLRHATDPLTQSMHHAFGL